jgi:2-oxoglutarate/2-oxoacid ferredoxin oxidoreductase subunit alpha
MQLTGDRFTSASALFGNDLATLPDFPAEIRAPAGTLAGVSASRSTSPTTTSPPGRRPERAGGHEPGGAAAELHRLEPGGTSSSTSTPSTSATSTKAGYAANPLTDGSLDGYTVYEVPMTSLTKEAVEPLGVKPRDAERSKNFFALGLVSWMYTRPVEPTLDWIDEKFAKNPQVRDANRAAFKAGHAFGETAELFDHPTRSSRPRCRRAPTPTSPATPRWRGAWWPPASSPSCRCSSAATRSPRRPTSSTSCRSTRTSACAPPGRGRDRRHRRRASAPPSAATWGHHHQRPGRGAQGETMGLAVSLELPLVIIDIQRAVRPPACPPRPRQADLLMAMYGRHGESPLPIVAAYSPRTASTPPSRRPHRPEVPHAGDPAVRRLPRQRRRAVALPDVATLPDISGPFATEPNHTDADGRPEFWPYLRDPETLARRGRCRAPRASMHRIGGIEKEDGSGNISYDPANHERMVHLRAAKVAGIADDIPPVEVDRRRRRRRPPRARVGLHLGRDRRAVDRAGPRAREGRPGPPHPPQPVPRRTSARCCGATRRVLVPEMNLGQLSRLLRAEYLVDARRHQGAGPALHRRRARRRHPRRQPGGLR